MADRDREPGQGQRVLGQPVTSPSTLVATPTQAEPRSRRPRLLGSGPARRPLNGYLFVLPYVVLLVLFGAIPVLYSVYLAFTDRDGKFAGIGNFSKVVGDFRFGPAVAHVAVFLVIWL